MALLACPAVLCLRGSTHAIVYSSFIVVTACLSRLNPADLRSPFTLMDKQLHVCVQVLFVNLVCSPISETCITNTVLIVRWAAKIKSQCAFSSEPPSIGQSHLVRLKEHCSLSTERFDQHQFRCSRITKMLWFRRERLPKMVHSLSNREKIWKVPPLVLTKSF